MLLEAQIGLSLFRLGELSKYFFVGMDHAFSSTEFYDYSKLRLSYGIDSSYLSLKLNKAVRPFWTINKQKRKMAYSKDLVIILIIILSNKIKNVK